MTVPAETTVGASLLYLAIDLGPRPTPAQYGREVEAVNTCGGTASASRRPTRSPRRRDGVAALWLQRLLSMTMERQRHRLVMQMGKRQLARSAQDLVDRHLAEELTTHAANPDGPTRPGQIEHEGTEVRDSVLTLSPVLDARMVAEGDDVP